MFFLINGEGSSGIGELRVQLEARANRLDAIEAATRIVEAEVSCKSVGRGGMPNILGTMQFDASILDGQTLRCGAVGALEHTPHALTVARQVMERLPHVFLVGAGADRFAREIGVAAEPALTDDARAKWEQWVGDSRAELERPDAPLAPWLGTSIDISYKLPEARPKDTVVTLVRDHTGHCASGASTSGWDFKYPGRVGDSPIIGAGHYADSRYGTAACTHTGEMTIRTCAAHSVVMNMKAGMSPKQAVMDVGQELRRLSGGHIGTVVIYAVNAEGEHYVATTGDAASYYFWREGTPEIAHLSALPLEVP